MDLREAIARMTPIPEGDNPEKRGRLQLPSFGDDVLQAHAGPIVDHFTALLKIIPSGMSRDGALVDGKSINLAVVSYGCAASTESAFMNIIEQLTENYEAAAD